MSCLAQARGELVCGCCAASQRTDDSTAAAFEELIAKRIQEYNSKTKPVADYYQEQGKFVAIDGIGEIDFIFGEISKAIEAA